MLGECAHFMTATMGLREWIVPVMSQKKGEKKISGAQAV
jgi:hypothetical protein